jgi:nitroimidazol reductase NimA-like FMN-containing flavoprotein (pyridoxamine 5'-phosphate oxidase superfamily)
MLRQTGRTTMTRLRERASYARDDAYEILDEGLVAHVGFVVHGEATVIPMTYARVGDELFLHGAVASRWLSSFDGRGRPVSVCVTLLDGLVLAQSAFSHSMNYRSVVCFGTASLLTDAARKAIAFRAFMDHILPGRFEDSRPPDAKETQATHVLAVPIDEASVKRREGPPSDPGKDASLGHWTGVLPLALTAGDPIPDPAMAEERPIPDYLEDYRR